MSKIIKLAIIFCWASLFLNCEVWAAQCSQEIGIAKANELVKQCLQASAATHPPCNVQNSCDMMREEIVRGCEDMKASGGAVPKFCITANQSASTTNTSSTTNAPNYVLNNNETVLFHTPSKNIWCVFSSLTKNNGKLSQVDCSIEQFSPSFDVAYASAHAEVENCPECCQPNLLRKYSVNSESIMGANVCPIIDFCQDGEGLGCNLPPLILNYGSKFQKNDLSCMSDQKGLTCTNQAGHGFFLSKGKQSIF